MTGQSEIRFNDGAAYERMMGVWSASAGGIFLDWLEPAPGLAWLDVGSGNGAFSELVIARCAPAHLDGIDPSDGQIAFARARLAGRPAEFQVGNAMALPFPEHAFDAVVMALVIFFVPDPAAAVAEMVRVARPGGLVASYSWDVLGGGLPFEILLQQMRAMGLNPPLPPQFAVSDIPVLTALWRGAGLEGVQTRDIAVTRRFDDLEDFWGAHQSGPMAQVFAGLDAAQTLTLKERLRAGLKFDAQGGVLCEGRALAIKGRVPA